MGSKKATSLGRFKNFLAAGPSSLNVTKRIEAFFCFPEAS